MDALEFGSTERGYAMTVAERSAQKRDQIQKLGERIRTILTQGGGPLDLPEIESRLSQQRRNETPPPSDSLNTFDVRDAVYFLVRRGEASYTTAGEIQRVESK